MNIQPPTSVGPSQGPTNVSFPTSSGGSSPGAGEGVRADWNVRMNVSHSQGYVGGAGRMLIHNQTGDERTEIVLYLPAARPERPGNLRLLSATVCSAKPGIPAAAGQSLVLQPMGARVAVTIPLLRLNDWIYIDLTWQGDFPRDGAAFPGGQVPLGEFHPQVAVDAPTSDGRKALVPLPARYDVTLGSDVGAVVRLESDEFGRVVSRIAGSGDMSEHEFKSYGQPHIQARLAPPGAITGALAGPGSATVAAPAQQPPVTTPVARRPEVQGATPARPTAQPNPNPDARFMR